MSGKRKEYQVPVLEVIRPPEERIRKAITEEELRKELDMLAKDEAGAAWILKVPLEREEKAADGGTTT